MRGRICSTAAALVVAWSLAVPVAGGQRDSDGGTSPADTRAVPALTAPRVAFVTFAKDLAERQSALALAESIRTFGGAWKWSQIRIYVPEDMWDPDAVTIRRFQVNEIELRRVRIPAESASFPYAGKVFAAALAESDLVEQCDLLVRMDPDTIVVKEPADIVIPREVAFAYVPVHQVLIGSLYAQPLDQFWALVYKRLGISEKAVFPVVTDVDGQTIRAYFSAGLVVARPSRGIFRRWREAFLDLSRDAAIKEMCRQDLSTQMYLHQVALAGAVLAVVPKAETAQLPTTYNYPLSLHRTPEPLDRFVTVRYDNLFSTPGWRTRIKAPAELVAWLRARFPDRPASQ